MSSINTLIFVSDVHLRNMMLDGNGKLKLIDFGRSQLCLEASVFGTANFYSDLRQLGLSIYEMLSGEVCCEFLIIIHNYVIIIFY